MDLGRATVDTRLVRALVSAVLLAAGCRASASREPAVDVEAQRWPAADAVFTADARWLGADGAYSVRLDEQRSLWLFGDTFVATSSRLVREESTMVRNTVGLQTGDDPTAANMDMFWREGPDGPEAFIGNDGEVWHWPLHGIVVDGALTLFFLREQPGGGLGFEAVGWTAFRVADPSGSPDQWTLETLATPSTPGLAVGTAVLATQTHVLAYAVEEPGDHDIRLLRWDRAAFVDGDLQAPQWYAGGTWVDADELSGRGDVVFSDAQTELSVSHLPALDLYVAVHSVGFGRTSIGVRTAPGPAGPWSDVRSVFRPPESDRDDTLVYAAKAHPWLASPSGHLAVTYAANAKDFGVLVSDTSLYWPRFVTLDITASR